MPLSQAYILHYRSSHNIKYFLSRATSIIYRIGTFGRHYLAVEIETFNRSLITNHAKILAKFLEDAENDFTQAFHTAMAQLKDHVLDTLSNNHNNTFIRFHQEYHHNTSYPQGPEPAITLPDTIPPSGKVKGVFSKKQMLILFDLLTQAAHLEKIDLSKPNKYEAIADLLCAITGKSRSSWKEELNNYKHKDLYTFHTEGQRKQLIADLVNIAELFRKAGFRSIANQADKKIRELEQYGKSE